MKKTKKVNHQKEVLKRLDKIIVLLEEKKTSVETSKLESMGLIKLEMKDYMTPKYLFDECAKLFNISSWIDLSKVTSERKGNYTVYFKDVQEADEENKNFSANDLKEKGVKGITLGERLLLEIVYFKKYGKHLDEINWTLCSGSRYSGGNVPGVYWNADDREVDVDWYDPDYRDDDLRARSAVKIEN